VKDDWGRGPEKKSQKTTKERTRLTTRQSNGKTPKKPKKKKKNLCRLRTPPETPSAGEKMNLRVGAKRGEAGPPAGRWDGIKEKKKKK